MRRVLHNPISLILFTLGTFLVLASLYGTLQKTRDSTESISVLKQEISQISSQVSSLETEVNEAKTPIAQEKIIRNELLMQKDGEVIVQLPELPQVESQAIMVPSPQPWDQWQELLF